MSREVELPLRAKLNEETGQVPWTSLLPFFARGDVIAVADDLNLLDVAVAVAEDRAAEIDCWMADARIGPVSDDQAKTWHNSEAEVWAVVVRPWVLVQERTVG